MKNSIGAGLILTLSGESHGDMICAVLDGLAPGIAVDEDFIASQLSRRRPSGPLDTARREKDDFRIVSGVFEGHTTGAPLTILIPNGDVRSSDYDRFHGLPRPSHADYAAHVRYAGYEDWRGGGHFSGRITVGIVAAGAIVLKALERKGIRIGTHILELSGIRDRDFEVLDDGILGEQIKSVNAMDFPVLSDVRGAMEEKILGAKADGDSVGGIVQTAVSGLPAGVGDPWFDSLEGAIANAVFSIGGIKGVEFGSGFALAGMRGSEAADEFFLEDDTVRTSSNHNGGINGGISNGMPVVFNAAVKPTPSISRPLGTVDLIGGGPAVLKVSGRHDPAIVRRICIVISSMTAIVIGDRLSLRFGTDYLR
ncbi:MAG: chorismate synthase [Bacteroidales bacterium]|nr:chorismate synthase [Bacteroidales bacterium]